MKFQALMKVAGPQYGCITWAQALEVMTKRQFQGLIGSKVVIRRYPGVYVVTGTAAKWHQRAMALTLSIDGSALSHQSSARMWGMGMAARASLAITVPPTWSGEREHVAVYRNSPLEPFVTTRDGLPLTTPARTIVDIAAYVAPEKLAMVIDQAFSARTVTSKAIQTCLDVMGSRGRKGATDLQTILSARNANDESAESRLERRTLSWIRAAQLREPVGHFAIPTPRTTYHPDLVYPDLRIVIETDGPDHLLPTVAASDVLRDADLMLLGWIVLRVKQETRRADFMAVLSQLLLQRAA